MKKRASFVAMYLCLLMLFTCGIGELVFVDHAARPSATENRMLQGFPTLSRESVFSGSFMDEFEAFLSDGFFFRDVAARFSDGVLGLFALPGDEVAIGAGDQPQLFDVDEAETAALEEMLQAAAPEEPSAAEAAPAQEAAQPLPAAGETEDVVMWLYDAAGNATELDRYDGAAMANFARILNEYRAELPADGTLHFISPPVGKMANAIIRGDYVDWSSNFREVMEPLVNEGVYIYEATDILRPLLSERLYPIVDMHWQPVGACRVADTMLAAQGIPPVDYDSYRYWLTGTGGGPFPTGTLAEMSIGPNTVPMPDPLSPVESYLLKHLDQRTVSTFVDHRAGSYMGYLGGIQGPWRLFITGFHTGRNALVIGDSFSNSFIPFLVPYYDQILSTDFRDGSYSLSEAGANAHEYIQHYGIQDIYVMMCTYSMFTNPTVQGRFDQYLNLDYGRVTG